MKLPKRRKLEKKTDYNARFNLLKSNQKRLVVRKTNRYIIAQIVETKIAQDKVLIGITSKILLNRGWPKAKAGSLKSIPASYLTGFLLGKLAQKQDIKKLVFDIGMHRNIHKSRLYSLLKGALDSGLQISYSSEILPSDEDLQKNENLYSMINKLKDKM